MPAHLTVPAKDSKLLQVVDAVQLVGVLPRFFRPAPDRNVFEVVGRGAALALAAPPCFPRHPGLGQEPPD